MKTNEPTATVTDLTDTELMAIEGGRGGCGGCPCGRTVVQPPRPAQRHWCW